MSLKLSDLQIRVQAPLNNGYDPTPSGVPLGEGTGADLWIGQLGVEVELDAATALALSNTSTGTLYGGLYKRVSFISAGSNTAALGQPVFWASTQTHANLFSSTGLQYTVSIDPSASIGDGFFAGVALVAGAAAAPSDATSATPQYGWIQTAGIASIIYKSSPTSTTIGTTVIVLTNTVTFDAITDATDTTSVGGILKNVVGIAAEAPGSAAVKRAFIFSRNKVY